MKKLLLLLSIVASSHFFLNAQSLTVGSYTTASGSTSQHFVYYDTKEKEFFLSCDGDASCSEYQIRFSNSQLKNFGKTMLKSKAKFLKWQKAAQKNGITNYTKKIPVHFDDKRIFFLQNGKWFSEMGANIHTEFYVNSDGQCFMILRSEPLNDDYVASEGHTMGGTLSYGALGNQTYLGNARSTQTVNVYANGLTVILGSEEIDPFLECLAQCLLARSQKNKNDKLFK